ncbi:MAG: hypothetical protein H7645_05700 [Candidatus Heimdallarchaeota archaeon]|nr:hypothetical protein [Candidatus Heimdallarchaeota archaeon]MCK4769817.1 hypothetical protein [Candidatus Heimdallarchaeota archaeon]
MSLEKNLDEALEWFNERISSNVSNYRNNAMKQIRSINDRIEELKTAAHRFDYSDLKDPDVYQNYATTIYDKTLEVFEQIQAPEIITYNNLENFARDTNNKINSYMNILSKYLSWLKRDRSYKTKVKTLDRALTRLKEELQLFENKTMLSYSEIINLEKVCDDITSLIGLGDRIQFLEKEIDSHKDDVEKLTQTIEKNEKELSEFKNHPGFQQLEKNKKELDHIEISISNKLSEIKKLSSKVLRAADSRKIELNEYDKELMKNLTKDPLGVFVKESEGYRGVKLVLNTLREISKEPAIQMKKEKLQRAYENIDEILNDEILEIQIRAQFLVQQSEAINDKFKEMQLDIKIKKLEDEIDNLKIDRNRITLSLRREKEEKDKEIVSLSKSVEERIEEFTGKVVKLNL